MQTSLVPITLNLPQPRAPRSAGVHVSPLIRGLALQNGKLNIPAAEYGLVDASQEDWWNQLDTVAKLRISMGLAWEEWYLPQLANVVDHPGELCVDGIYMTPDGESLDVIYGNRGYQVAIHEVKLTYKSVRTVTNLTDEFMWMSQTMAYCKGSGTTTAYLHALFVCGDYSYPIRPRLGPIEEKMYCWRLDFTQQEIDSKWAEIRAYRDAQREMGTI